MNKIALSLAGLALATGFATAQAALVYEQAALAGPNVGYTWTSHVESGIGGWQTQDDFQLGQTAGIGRVTWRGIYLEQNGNGQPNTANWKVQFWSDVGGAGGPGTPVYTTTVADADVTRHSVAGGGFFGSTPVDVYDFDLLLPTSFTANANVKYWFSVVSDSAQPDWWPLFGWTMAEGNVETHSSHQQSLSAADAITGDYTRAGDRAFALYTVPEPASLALVGLALVAGVASRRPRRASALG